MRVNLASVLVDDQDKALRFYPETLGFKKKTDFPVGEARWLTVVPPEDPTPRVNACGSPSDRTCADLRLACFGADHGGRLAGPRSRRTAGDEFESPERSTST